MTPLNSSSEADDLDLLLRYVKADVTADERVRIESAMTRDPRVASRVTAMRAAQWDGEQELEAVLAMIDGRHRTADAAVDATPDKTKRPTHGVGGYQPRGVRQLFPYAVVALLIGAFGFLAGHGVRFGTVRRAQATMSTYVTGNGQRANITLPDGNLVSLNVGSRLEVPADYANGNHTLRLSGEALFLVRHHDGAPFVVQSGDAAARVLGTGFLIRHYATDTATTIAVRDGKVMVQASVATSRDGKPYQGPSRVLTAGEQSEVSGRVMTAAHAADPSQYTFATGVLTLENVSLARAIVELSRWYDLDIRLGDPRLATRQIEAGFAADAAPDLVPILEATVGVRAVRAGRVLTLYPRDRE